MPESLHILFPSCGQLLFLYFAVAVVLSSLNLVKVLKGAVQLGLGSLSAALAEQPEKGSNCYRENSFQKYIAHHVPSNLRTNYSWVETNDLGLVIFLSKSFLKLLGEVNICQFRLTVNSERTVTFHMLKVFKVYFSSLVGA